MVSADETAAVVTHLVNVENNPSTGHSYPAPLKLTVTGESPGSSVGEVGVPLLGVVGGLLLLKVGLIGALFLAGPGDGRDLILKRQLLNLGFPECSADAISALMWKFHKLTGTPMGNNSDTDNDGLTDLEERKGKRNTAFGMRATNPFAADTDGDGTNDGFEIARGTDPNVKN